MVELKGGGFYNWKNQPERLIYLGSGTGASSGWHQFALVESPSVVWCEVLYHELVGMEPTIDAAMQEQEQ